MLKLFDSNTDSLKMLSNEAKEITIEIADKNVFVKGKYPTARKESRRYLRYHQK